MTDEQRTERIEAYLDNVLSEQERLDFETDMTAHEDLRKQVLLQETIRLAFKKTADIPFNKQMDELFEQNRHRFGQKLDTSDIDADFLKEMGFDSEQQHTITTPFPILSGFRSSTVLKPIYKKSWFLLAIAASLTLMLTIGFWWFMQKDISTEGVTNKPSVIDNTLPQIIDKNKTSPNPPAEKQPNPLAKPSNGQQIGDVEKQASDFIQTITTLADVEKNIAATVMSSATNQDLYEIAVKKYVTSKGRDTEGFEQYLKTDVKADSYRNIKRLVHACFRLKNYEKAMAYCLIGQKLTDLEPDEKKELGLLLLESYYGAYPKYKTLIKNIGETGSMEEKNLIKIMEANGFKK